MEHPRRTIEPKPLTPDQILQTRIGARGLEGEHGKAQLRFVREDLAKITDGNEHIKTHFEDGVSIGAAVGATRADLESILAMKRLGVPPDSINRFLDMKEEIERERENPDGSTPPSGH